MSADDFGEDRPTESADDREAGDAGSAGSEKPGATSYTTGDPGVDAVLADLGPMTQQLAADAEARQPLDVDAALELLTGAHQRLADRLSGLD